MMTLRKFAAGPLTVPASTAWYLADLGEAKGRQALYTRQSPQRLKVLLENALIESAVSSNRIEGVTLDKARIRPVILGRALLRDRDEEEVRGYRNALSLVHRRGAALDVSEATLRELHRISRGEIWDAGKFKQKDVDIIERSAQGDERVRFRTVPAARTAGAVRELVSLWKRSTGERTVPPLVALAAFNLDLLCIHPFRDGNGRVSRLLLLLQCYHLGFEVGRYVSLERLIEQNKERYYETLEHSSQRWHEGRHDPWHYINYLLFVLKNAYREFEARVGKVASPRGAKTELVHSAVDSMQSDFTLAELERACPGVSRDMVRRVLRDLQRARRVTCLGRGPGARWRRKGTVPERG